ncbi:uncharacterized protein K460DRAFT_185283 [Cucurbitaria berberidis CBS 394.84]|uniref:Uncharacterized protein n=1 Tax=Cucurbitaria berberidis CBS 394.84 TaxID=1168544 RepID=A0A9P4GBG5_9PLEO|nr:uncharacterized protein K460DRAFT_185283 [Cucurbitaria berberidis CBS 394.84]KAF1842444.1 hypothetical protein K460DRAFT_185283 [Cucurbitaria berberidis CBS 394.84]
MNVMSPLSHLPFGTILSTATTTFSHVHFVAFCILYSTTCSAFYSLLQSYPLSGGPELAGPCSCFLDPGTILVVGYLFFVNEPAKFRKKKKWHE